MTLRIREDATALVRLCRPLWETLLRAYPEMGRQLRRSVLGVALNLAEGDGRYDGNGRERLRTALYEARETLVNLETAVAAGFLTEVETRRARGLADKVAGTVYKLVGRRRQ